MLSHHEVVVPTVAAGHHLEGSTATLDKLAQQSQPLAAGKLVPGRVSHSGDAPGGVNPAKCLL